MEASHVSRWKRKEESSTGAQQMRGALIHPLAKAIAFKIRRDTIAHCTYVLEGNHKCIFYTTPLCGHHNGIALMEAIEPRASIAVVVAFALLCSYSYN